MRWNRGVIGYGIAFAALVAGHHGADEILSVRETGKRHRGDVKDDQDERQVGEHLVHLLRGFAESALPALFPIGAATTPQPRQVPRDPHTSGRCTAQR